jgi:signal transduction histidine kinase
MHKTAAPIALPLANPQSFGFAWAEFVCLAFLCIAFRVSGADAVDAMPARPLPLLGSVGEIRSLTPAQAALGYPVRIRAVVTHQGPSGGGFFVQDSHWGIYVAPAVPGTALRLGQLVEVEGTPQPGNYAVEIQEKQTTVLGEGAMPAPRLVSLDQLASGMEDSQWVEVRGFVRSVTHSSDGSVYLDIVNGGARLRVFSFSSIGDFSPLVECAVRLQGVAGTIFNLKRQLIAPIVYFSSISNIVVEAAAPKEPFDTPATTVRQLFEFSPAGPSEHRVKIRGVVTGQLPGGAIFIRDERDGLCVETKTLTPVQPGDIVEVLGFPATGRFNPILQDSTFRKMRHGPAPDPVMTTVPAFLQGGLDAELVTVEAGLLGGWSGRRERFLTLQEKGITFNANITAAQGEQRWPSLREGSRLKLTGVCLVQEVVQEGSKLYPASFRLLLRSPHDIVVLKQPSWWTPARLLWLVCGAVATALTASLWVMILKRRMLDQAEIIRTQLQREGILDERARIAREFHDTLEQELTGISLQLDMVAVQVADHPVAGQIEVAQRLLRRSQEEAHRSVWDLRCGAFEQGGLAAALKETAEQSGRRAGVDVQVSLPEKSGRLPILLEHHLLRISQEAINNAVRHGHAKIIHLDLAFDSQEVRLQVRDDGCGFAAEGLPKGMSGHFGLLGMRERAEKMGGSFSIISRPGSGTEVEVKVPLPRDTDGVTYSRTEASAAPADFSPPI